nr:hypothetical protein CFP56_52526 [Quercus suber]
MISILVGPGVKETATSRPGIYHASHACTEAPPPRTTMILGPVTSPFPPFLVVHHHENMKARFRPEKQGQSHDTEQFLTMWLVDA